ncbi:hypothetical protein [Kitasatospora sp. NPDC093102]|uniref:hypothetical protein n=1 Tax=Kitasatospora sp. NPDC093102 TaxID=3155069 RepID=UPI003437C464
MTTADHVYADTLNLFGSDPVPPEIDAMIARLRAAAELSHRVEEGDEPGQRRA